MVLWHQPISIFSSFAESKRPQDIEESQEGKSHRLELCALEKTQVNNIKLRGELECVQMQGPGFNSQHFKRGRKWKLTDLQGKKESSFEKCAPWRWKAGRTGMFIHL